MMMAPPGFEDKISEYQNQNQHDIKGEPSEEYNIENPMILAKNS